MVFAVFRATSFGIFPQADFDGSDNNGFIVATLSALRPPAYKALINFDQMFSADGVTIWADHSGSELMEYLEGGFIPRKAELSLELEGRLTRRLSRDQISAPKPHGKRCMGLLHDRALRQRGIGLALPAAKDHRGTAWKSVGFA